MGENSKPHHLPLEPAVPPLTLSSPDLVAVVTQVVWWDELISMNLPSSRNLASHELGPPFHTLVNTSGRTLNVLAYTGDTAMPDAQCVDAITHALTCLVEKVRNSTTLNSIHIPFGSSFVRSTSHSLLLSALPSLGFSPGKPTTLSILSNALINAQVPPPIHPPLHLSEVTTPEDMSTRIGIESSLFEYPPSHTEALKLALEYMTYGTSPQARDHHYLAWVDTPHQPDELIPVAYFTLRLGRGVAYVQGAGVLAPWRRRGIARAMLGHATATAARLGYQVVCTSAWDDDAAAAWRAMGFEDVGEYTEWTWDKAQNVG